MSKGSFQERSLADAVRLVAAAVGASPSLQNATRILLGADANLHYITRFLGQKISFFGGV